MLKASYTLNWTLGGGFSLLNIALHAMNEEMLFLIAERLYVNIMAALIEERVKPSMRLLENWATHE